MQLDTDRLICSRAGDALDWLNGKHLVNQKQLTDTLPYSHSWHEAELLNIRHCHAQDAMQRETRCKDEYTDAHCRCTNSLRVVSRWVEVDKYLLDGGIEGYRELAQKRNWDQCRSAMITLNGGTDLRGLLPNSCSYCLVYQLALFHIVIWWHIYAHLFHNVIAARKLSAQLAHADQDAPPWLDTSCQHPSKPFLSKCLSDVVIIPASTTFSGSSFHLPNTLCVNKFPLRFLLNRSPHFKPTDAYTNISIQSI